MRSAPAVLTVAGLAAIAVLGGCAQGKPPTVALSAGKSMVRAQATRWCPDGKKCSSHRVKPAVLTIGRRSDVTVDVGATVAKRPWIVLVDKGTASPLQRHARTFRIVALRPGVTVDVVTVDSDGTKVLQRDHWVFTIT
ncbi:MAG: hypothetical protein ABJA34_07820 [Pseudonocardiales bacterium]